MYWLCLRAATTQRATNWAHAPGRQSTTAACLHPHLQLSPQRGLPLPQLLDVPIAVVQRAVHLQHRRSAQHREEQHVAVGLGLVGRPIYWHCIGRSCWDVGCAGAAAEL